MQRWIIRSDADLDLELAAIAAVLEKGGIIAVPTGSFYALAADVRCGEALNRLQRLKGRGLEKPLLVLVATASAAREPGAVFAAIARRACGAFLAGSTNASSASTR